MNGQNFLSESFDLMAYFVHVFKVILFKECALDFELEGTLLSYVKRLDACALLIIETYSQLAT